MEEAQHLVQNGTNNSVDSIIQILYNIVNSYETT